LKRIREKEVRKMNGYVGRILRVDLTERKVSAIDTREYEDWVGGHGFGSALFWDLVQDKAISGFDPGNVVTIMTSPLTGTMAPAASGRTEVQGIGVHSSPIEWFTRSNFGGRFGSMLKYAGWDGIVIEGKADRPVWVDIRNHEVKIKDAGTLWGMDTWETQQAIWQEVTGTASREWVDLGTGDQGSRTTQKPAVLTIGPAGENLCRVACLIHEAGNASGQGGFGAVWGSKNLKAISVIGTGSIEIADPNALLKSRLWAQKQYGLDFKNPRLIQQSWFSPSSPQVVFWRREEEARLQACLGCHLGCRERSHTGLGNESSCVETEFYAPYDRKRHSSLLLRGFTSVLARLGQEAQSAGLMYLSGKQTSAARIAADLLQKYGINAYEMYKGLAYIRDLHKMGVLGPGKDIDCDLPFDKLGEVEFVEKFLSMIAYRQGIGEDMAQGFFRAAKIWGRQEEDLRTGLLQYPYWGLPEHNYDPRAEIEWGYGSILSDRDINEHDFNFLFWMPSLQIWNGMRPVPTAERVANVVSEKLVPYEGDPLMLDFSTENMYSDHMVKLVAWHRHYTRFWKQSVLYCDLRWPDFYNNRGPDYRGLTGEGEPKFLNAVTGKDYTFREGMELGRKIWNLDNAIWTLQGRHRDLVHFADYIYKMPYGGSGLFTLYYMPGRENGEWKYISVNERYIDKAHFEEWKTRFYSFEGWDPKTGWPTRNTLKSLGMSSVADTIEKRGKLGKV
jgi:aldehyde:ferredoxin oxidoreductase